MDQVEPSHEEGEEEREVTFREDDLQPVETTPPTPITSNDMDVIIRGWEIKFEQIHRCLRDVQLASEKANSDMFSLSREGRAREDEQERRLEAMHVGLTEFLQKCDPAHLTTTRHFNAPTASTPYTPSTPTGIPARLRPDFEFQPSPVGQDEPTEPARSTISHTRDHDDIRSTRTWDHDDIRNTRNRDHDDIRDKRIRDHDVRDTRTRDLHDNRDRDRDIRCNDRPTHEDDRGDSGDMQRNSYHNGMNSSMSRPSSSPKVPTFDGTISAQFRPWIIQFEAIACHQGWTLGERVVRLVSSLTGPATNLLIGMTLGQLDDYNFLRARLSRRYDPPEREEAHRAELRARTRRRNESADEFAENIKNLAQRAYPSADQNMLDNLVVERFREGHGNEELKKHLCLYPSTGLQDLIGACVRFETHVEIGSHARKSNEGLYTVQSSNKTELALEEVTRAARRLGPRLNQSVNSGACQQNPIRRQTPVGEIKCWTCGKTGHYASDCKSNGPKLAFAPKTFRMNLLQQIADQMQEYSEGEQNHSEGNE